MTAVKSFTCLDCGAIGKQPARGRKRIRCIPCRQAHQAAQESQRQRPSRRLTLAPSVCGACGAEYEPRRRDQRWCSRKCKNAHHNERFRLAGGTALLSPGARERQRQYWQAKCRRRRAAKRGGVSEPYTLAQIAERDGFSCQLCGGPVPMETKVPDALAPTVDHVVPVSRGGDDTRANVQLAHFRCNSVKGARDVQRMSLAAQEVSNGAC